MGSDGGWKEERILVTVKTYPAPSGKDIEVVCTAGIRESGGFIRLFPIPFRMLEADRRFSKYAWIRAPIKKASDFRPESYTVDYSRIELQGSIDTKRRWEERRALVEPLLSASIEELRKRNATEGVSLGVVKPKDIIDFSIRPSADTAWSEDELMKLRRQDLFLTPPPWLLEKIPFDFVYKFRCDDPTCTVPHTMKCLDWEVAQAYRQYRRKYGSEWRPKMIERFSDYIIGRCDTHFFVGTMKAHPTTWTLIGLFYPLKA